MSQFLKLFIEAGPLVVFFVTNSQFGLKIGTICFMLATVISVIASLSLDKKVPIMPLITCGFVVVFGSLTIFLDNDMFIKIKPTIVNLLFAATLLGGQLVGRSMLKPLLGSVLMMKDEGWRILSWRWGFFFVALAIINEIVWRNSSTEFWIGFKLFGLMPLTIVFSFFQLPVILKHQIPEETSKESSS